MLALLTINFFENSLLLIPMMITFSNIVERHLILQNSIQTTLLEEKSYSNALLLVVGSVIAVLGSFLLEIILFTAYNRLAHIWKNLLNMARLHDKENNPNSFNLEEVLKIMV